MPPRYQNSTAASRGHDRTISQSQSSQLAAVQNPNSLSSLPCIQKPSIRYVPPYRTRAHKSFLIFILLQRITPPLPIELVIRILGEAALYRCTAVSSWRWPDKFDQSLRTITSAFESKWPLCLSNRYSVHGPGLHPLKSIVIRWQWNQRRRSNLGPHVYLWLIPADDGKDILGEKIEIVERPPVQYHKIQRTAGTITISRDNPIIANAQAGDRVLAVLCASVDPRELTVRYFCAW